MPISNMQQIYFNIIKEGTLFDILLNYKQSEDHLNIGEISNNFNFELKKI